MSRQKSFKCQTSYWELSIIGIVIRHKRRQTRYNYVDIIKITRQKIVQEGRHHRYRMSDRIKLGMHHTGVRHHSPEVKSHW